MAEGQTRIEHDSMGELEVAAGALWGAQTERARRNFQLSGLRQPRSLLRALGLIKAACARVNGARGALEPGVAAAIESAALAVARGDYDDSFPLDVFQTGSGTSTNMNANEVIARLAGQALGRPVHPNDQVNCAQSSNDVIPSAIHLGACLLVTELLVPALLHLAAAIDTRAKELDGIVKTGRTHLMDAVPLTLGQELGGWRALVLAAVERIESTLPRVRGLAIGATAVGTGLNAPAGFGDAVCRELAQLCGESFYPAPDYFAALGSQDTAVELSGQARGCAVSLTKIANDLRWMNSGPLAGLGEIRLQALQPGSSIMPGKVNPVIPEAVLMIAAQVIGNDTTVALGGAAGNFQLNVMLPVIGYNLLQSLELLGHAARSLADQAICGFTVNEPRLTRELARNPVLATALNPVIGYELAAEIAKAAAASGESVESVALRRTDLDRTALASLLDPRHLTRGGGDGGGAGG